MYTFCGFGVSFFRQTFFFSFPFLIPCTWIWRWEKYITKWTPDPISYGTTFVVNVWRSKFDMKKLTTIIIQYRAIKGRPTVLCIKFIFGCSHGCRPITYMCHFGKFNFFWRSEMAYYSECFFIETCTTKKKNTYIIREKGVCTTAL